jgi:NADPH:quinone reductase-like Zn-dependent oxidoreductase
VGSAPGDETALGYEAAGVISKISEGVSGLAVGDRVMVFEKGSFTNRVRARPARIRRIPDGMAFEDAATIPLNYLTALHSLLDHANLTKDKIILIHSAASDVGTAAVQIAQSIGAEVYTSVSTTEEKEFLKSVLQVPEGRIFDTHDASFGELILAASEGNGMDVVLNASVGATLDESFRILNNGGIILDIGKKDVLDRTNLPVSSFDRSSSFKTIDFTPESASDALISTLMTRLFELIDNGSIRRIAAAHRFGWDDIAGALRFIRQGKHIGRVVLTQNDEVKLPVSTILSWHHYEKPKREQKG